ncbi:MAG: flagellar basal body P-ring formation chaperone FlgA [Pseudomonadota bacterium]
MINNIWNNTSLALKAACLLIAIFCLGIGAMIGTKAAMAASLKPITVVEGDVLRLGDIFEGVHSNKDYVIGAAPQPGQDMVLNARTLYRIAVAMDLPWRPQTMGDQVTIRREAQIISYNQIEDQIRNSLKDNGLVGNFTIELSNGQPSIVLPNNAEQNVEVASFTFDRNKDLFDAVIVAPSTENPIRRMSIKGRVDRLVNVPVLRVALQNGDIISENDIEIIEVSEKELQHNVILDVNDMVGLTPRRIAYAGRFVLDGILERPKLIERGDRITIRYQKGALNLTAKGKALQGGAKGDIVRVSNNASSQTITAIVEGNKMVIVQ